MAYFYKNVDLREKWGWGIANLPCVKNSLKPFELFGILFYTNTI